MRDYNALRDMGKGEGTRAGETTQRDRRLTKALLRCNTLGENMIEKQRERLKIKISVVLVHGGRKLRREERGKAHYI